MSYFGSEKKMLLSISAIYSSATQTLTTSDADLSIFNGLSITQLVSSIGYPTISVVGGVITLQDGWHYLLNLHLKIDSPSSATTENAIFYVSDISNTPISSIGKQIVYRDTTSTLTQENCIVYINALNQSVNVKTRARKSDATAMNIGTNTDSGTVSYRSYLLIKAWK